MRNVFEEYRDGLISWDQAFMTANNISALTSVSPEAPEGEVDYWTSQMESLGIDASSFIMKLLGYRLLEDGTYIKPNIKGNP